MRAGRCSTSSPGQHVFGYACAPALSTCSKRHGPMWSLRCPARASLVARTEYLPHVLLLPSCWIHHLSHCWVAASSMSHLDRPLAARVHVQLASLWAMG